MTDEQGVGGASDAFYAALTQMLAGDASAMAAVWSHSGDVTAMHPLGGREVGWEAVAKSFQNVAALASGGKVEARERRVQVVGDLAYEVNVEHGRGTLGGETVEIDHRATNVYRREAGAWRMVHHHADWAPAMVDLVRRLQSR
jgi:ketosteroid isomerase-like protein